jgi:SAM-dependent methyltransferase
MKSLIEKIKGKSISDLSKLLYAKAFDRCFDLRYDIETSSHVHLENLDFNDEQKKLSYWYEGTYVVQLRKLFKKLQIPKEKVFVDIGSGKGRVLLIAAEYGFEKIRGIELSPNLCETARKNISVFRNKKKYNSDIVVINKNALEYNFTDDEGVFFLYNPFGEHILEQVMTNIKNSILRNRRSVKIIYVNPVHENIIKENMAIVKTASLRLHATNISVFDV